MFNDFEIGPQCEEVYKDLEEFYDIYDVDCDDGTQGDKIYVVKSEKKKRRHLYETYGEEIED